MVMLLEQDKLAFPEDPSRTHSRLFYDFVFVFVLHPPVSLLYVCYGSVIAVFIYKSELTNKSIRMLFLYLIALIEN